MTKTARKDIRITAQMQAALNEYAQLTGCSVTAAIEQMMFAGLMEAGIFQKHLGDNAADVIRRFEDLQLKQALATVIKAGYRVEVPSDAQ